MFTILIVFIITIYVGGQVTKEKNPYINAHKKKWRNEKHYDRYLKWLDRKGGDAPIKIVKNEQEKKLDKEINKHLNK